MLLCLLISAWLEEAEWDEDEGLDLELEVRFEESMNSKTLDRGALSDEDEEREEREVEIDGGGM